MLLAVSAHRADVTGGGIRSESECCGYSRETPASSKLAMFRRMSVAVAARFIVSVAPVPSPRRIPKSRTGTKFSFFRAAI